MSNAHKTAPRDAELIITSPAVTLTKLNNFFPGPMSLALGVANFALPKSDKKDSAKKGFKSESDLSPNIVTKMTSDRAISENNEDVKKSA